MPVGEGACRYGPPTMRSSVPAVAGRVAGAALATGEQATITDTHRRAAERFMAGSIRLEPSTVSATLSALNNSFVCFAVLRAFATSR